ncbi:MAG: hypothetical protein ACYTEO_15445 [Planctomycetota bacterium]|jgi:hypothetical protein
MKTFIRIITVLAVLNLTMVSFAPAEYSADEEPTLIADEEVGVAAVEPLPTETAARTTGEANVAKTKGAYNYIYTPYTSPVTKKQASGAGAVLVIPSVEMKDEEFTAIMEDLNVMSRIFDKKLGPQQELLSTFTRGSV